MVIKLVKFFLVSHIILSVFLGLAGEIDKANNSLLWAILIIVFFKITNE